jgi:hypothetical protein
MAITTVAAANNEHDLLKDTHLPYPGDGEGEEKIEIDLVVFDREKEILSAYEIKRANGSYDNKAKNALKRATALVKILLKSYAEQRGLHPRETRTHIIFYYGVRSIPAPLGLIGKELDEHFGMPVWAPVETVNKYYRTRLFEVLSR